MKRLLPLALVLLSSFSAAYAQDSSNPPRAADTQISDASRQRSEWFREARFGMFIHFGLYSILGGTYNGHTLPDKTLKNGNNWYAEWAQTRLEIPTPAYQALTKQFDPVNFNADKWASDAAAAGMKYMVITSKHHDGFALWDSGVSDYDIGATPFKGHDLLGELKKACQKHGLKFGLYYSHWQDWQAPGGAWPSWSPVKRTPAEFDVYWHTKCLPQVKELIQRYDPDILWFDTWGDGDSQLITPAKRDELIALIRKMSPKCLINGRILYSNPGNDVDFLEMNDNHYPNQILATPWQAPATMERSWGWHANDHAWKPAHDLLANLLLCTSRGGNYLLNVGPKPDGTFPAPALSRLQEIGGWLTANGDAVYGTTPVFTLTAPKDVTLTQRKNVDGTATLYAALLSPPPGNSLTLPIPADNITDCSILDTSLPLKYAASGDGVTITTPDSQDMIPVVKITLKSPLAAAPSL